jgi:hypothetical protein
MTGPVRPVRPQDQLWVDIAAELTPAKTLERTDKAKAAATTRITTTVTVVGTLLTGLGVLAAGQPAVSGTARLLVAIAVAASALAVACVLGAQVAPRRFVNPSNLAEVRAWYRRQTDTGRYSLTAGTFLVIFAALLAGVAAIVSLSAPASESSMTISRVLQPSGGGQASTSNATMTTLKVMVTFRGLPPGHDATVSITARTAGKILATAVVVPTPGGTATSSLTISGIPSAETIAVSADTPNQHCLATLSPGQSRPALTCRPS